MDESLPNENDADYSGISISHQILSGPKRFDRCRFVNSDMNYAVVHGIEFVECDFSQADISSAEFENCDFVDCIFNFTNFSYSTFLGCHFKETAQRSIDNTNFDHYASLFANAGTSNTAFLRSETRRGRFQNVHFRDMGFRYTRFSGIDFIGTTTYCVPFECATLEDCSIDVFDTRTTNMRGARIANCEIQLLRLVLEKTLSFVGIEFLFQCKEVQVYVQSDQLELLTDDLKSTTLVDALSGAQSTLRDRGAILQLVNLSIYRDLVSHRIASEDVDATYLHEKAKDLLETRDSPLISISNLIGFIDLILHYKAYSKELLGMIYQLLPTTVTPTTNERQRYELFYKLQLLAHAEMKSTYRIRFIDHDNEFLTSDRYELSSFVGLVLSLTGLQDAKPVSQQRGSVIEDVLVNGHQFIENFWQFALVLFILGFKCRVKSKDGNLFTFSLSGHVSDETKADQRKEPNGSKAVMRDLEDLVASLKELDIPIGTPPSEASDFSNETDDLHLAKKFVLNRRIEISIRYAESKELLSTARADSMLLDHQQPQQERQGL